MSNLPLAERQRRADLSRRAMRAAAQVVGVGPEALRGRSGRRGSCPRGAARTRWVAWEAMRRATGLGVQTLATALGADHSSLLHGARRVRADGELERRAAEAAERVREALG